MYEKYMLKLPKCHSFTLDLGLNIHHNPHLLLLIGSCSIAVNWSFYFW